MAEFDLGTYGAEIVIDDSQFTQGLTNAEQSIQATDSKVKGFGKNLGSLAVGAVAGLGVALGGAMVAGVKMADELDKALNGLQAATGATDKEMKGMEDSLKNIYSAGYGESFDEIANSMALVKQNTGLVGAELENATKSAYMLSDTFGLDVTESSRSAKAMMENFGISSKDAYNLMAQGAQNGANKNGDLLDTLNEYSPAYSALGFSAEEFTNTLIDGAKNGSFSIDKVGDSIKEFNIRAKDGSKTSADAFQALGFNAENMTSKFAAGGDTAQTAFQDVVKAISAIEDPVQKNAVAVGLFGTQAEDLEMSAIQAFANIGNEASLTNDALGKINEVNYSSFGEAMTGIGRNLQLGLIEPMQQYILPLLSDFANFIIEHMPQIQATISTVFSFIGQSVKTVVDIISGLAPTLSSIGSGIGGMLSSITGWEGFVPVITGLVTAFTAYKAITMASTIATTAMATAQGLMNAVMALNPVTLVVAALVGLGVAMVVAYQKSETFRNIVNGVWDSIKNVWQATVDFFTTSIPNWVNGIISNFEEFKTSALEKWNSIVEGIGNKLEEFKTSVDNKMNEAKAKVEEIWDSIQAFFDGINIMETGRRIIQTMIDGFTNMITPVLTKVTELWNNAVGFLQGINIAENAKAIFTTFINGIGVTISSVRSKVEELWGKAQSYFEGINLLQIGKNIIQGLINGIANMKNNVINKAREIADSVTDTIKKALQIHSPSVVMAQLGKNVVEGFAQGIDDNGGLVEDAVINMADFADKIISTLKSAYGKQKEFALAAIDDEMEALDKSHDKKMNRYDEELDKISEISQAKLDSIDEQENNDNYNNKLADLQGNQANINSKIQSTILDNSIQAQLRRKKLEEELADVTEQIEVFKHNREKELRKESLQEEIEKNKKAVEAKKEAEDNKYDAAKARLEKEKRETAYYYDEILANERYWNEIRTDIINGETTKIQAKLNGFLDDFKDKNKEVVEDLGSSYQELQNLLDDIISAQNEIDAYEKSENSGSSSSSSGSSANGKFTSGTFENEKLATDFQDYLHDNYETWLSKIIKDGNKYRVQAKYESVDYAQSVLDDVLKKDRIGAGYVSTYHSGGWVGNISNVLSPLLKKDEVPAILQTGEFVLSRAMISNMSDFGMGMNRINSAKSTATTQAGNQSSNTYEFNNEFSFTVNGNMDNKQAKKVSEMVSSTIINNLKNKGKVLN